jgi:hypothetical protein
MLSSMACAAWPDHHSHTAAGTASGDVVSVNVQRQAVQALHPICSGAVGALLLAPSGNLLVGSADGSILQYNFPVCASKLPCTAAISQQMYTYIKCTPDYLPYQRPQDRP